MLNAPFRVWLIVLLAFVGVVEPASAQSFTRQPLAGAEALRFPTTLQWGPDGRLYVGTLQGPIWVYSVVREGLGQYRVVASEEIRLLWTELQNHNDDGSLHTGPGTARRQVTGILVAGTPEHPVIYVSSSDYRIAVGEDSGLDTNSGVISRITWDGTQWVHLALVRGLPRNEENHSPNGMWLDETTNTLYLAQGGNTNMGAPSNNFAFQREYALSAAILSIDLDAIGEATYDLPTLDDPDRPGNPDENDPFGGNNGLNQAMLVAGGPVQVYSPGYRNPYDIAVTTDGRMYTIDNGPNRGWGGPPVDCSNDPNELDTLSYGDGLHLVTGPGYYGGHPNPTRADAGNTFAGQSPVAFADPVQCEYLVPGVDDAALWVFPESTNGICEYTASNFEGAMAGNLLALDVAGTMFRIRLSPDGTVAEEVTPLVQNGGELTLDVVARGDSEDFAGTIWYTAMSDSLIYVMEPVDFSGCTGAYDFSIDEDGDGFSNADEIENGTDVCSPASTPNDADGDFLSDLLDPDDDNDGIDDTIDPFATDGTNGTTLAFPFYFEWSVGDPGYGLFGLGFTGLMANGALEYDEHFDPANLTAGGAAGRLTVDNVGRGDAYEGLNSQDNAFQLALPVGEHTGRFRVGTQADSPFFGGYAPAGEQSVGMVFGLGDQDNYIKIVLGAVQPRALVTRLRTITRGHANRGGGNRNGTTRDGTTGQSQTLPDGRLDAFASGLRKLGDATMPGLRVVYERDGVVRSVYEEARPGILAEFSVRFDFVVDPSAGTVQPRAALPDGSFEDVGPAIVLDGALLDAVRGVGELPPAAGIIATARGGRDFAATWDYFEAEVLDDGAAATVRVTTPNPGYAGSTYTHDAFQIENTSPAGQSISWVEYDFSTAMMPDMVIDPDGLAGDTIGKGFTPDSGEAETGLVGYAYQLPKDAGYAGLRLTFDDFAPGEVFTFSIDMDPSSIRGATAPGPFAAGSVSGLELAGARVRVGFTDGTVLAGDLFRDGDSLNDSIAMLRAGTPTRPRLGVVGVDTPADFPDAEQTVRIWGPRGSSVSLLRLEAGLFTESLPDGGYDIGPFEPNSVVSVRSTEWTIGSSGWVDVAVTLARTRVESGYNIFAAAVTTPEGRGLVSAPLVARLRQSTFTVTPSPIQMPEAFVDTTVSRSIEISNGTAQDLLLDQLVLSGSPEVWISGAPTLPVLVPQGGSVMVELSAAPTEPGQLDATLGVVSADPVTEVVVPITGKGIVPPLAYRLNAGGPVVQGVSGPKSAWSGDLPGDPATELTGVDPTPLETTEPITGTAEIPASVSLDVFATARQADTPGGTITLTKSLDPGRYEVRLFFAEIDPAVTMPGDRVFDIFAEGVLEYDDVDLLATGTPYTASQRRIDLVVSDGTLDLVLQSETGTAILNAVQISRLD